MPTFHLFPVHSEEVKDIGVPETFEVGNISYANAGISRFRPRH